MTPEERAEKVYSAIAAEAGRGGAAAQIRIIATAIRMAERVAELREREAIAHEAELEAERVPPEPALRWFARRIRARTTS